MERKFQTEETPQLPISEPAARPAFGESKQEVQIEAPTLIDKLKLHKKKILIGLGLFFGILVFAGAVLVAYKLSQKQVSPTAQITPPPAVTKAPTPIPDPTADWETYRNENVTFKFPSRWIEKPILIHGSGFDQEFEDPEGKFFLTFSSTGNYNQVTGKAYTNIDEYINMPHQVKVVVIDGQEARQPLPRAGSENVNAVIFFSKDSKFIYILRLQTGSTAFENTPSDASETDVEEGKRVFDPILSTFKFLESYTPSSNPEECSVDGDCVLEQYMAAK